MFTLWPQMAKVFSTCNRKVLMSIRIHKRRYFGSSHMKELLRDSATVISPNGIKLLVGNGESVCSQAALNCLV
jgi:hypothetical protein